MEFLLACGRGSPVLFQLEAGEHITLGRGSANDVVMPSQKVSGLHLSILVRLQTTDGDAGNGKRLELCVQDTSTNGTGVRDKASDEFQDVSPNELRPLSHGSELLVPSRTAAWPIGEQSSARPDGQLRLTVHFPHLEDRLHPGPGINDPRELPDMWQSSSGHGRWRYYEQLGEGGLGVVYRAFDMTGGLGTVAIKVSKWGAKTHGACAKRSAWQVYIMHREAQWSRQCLHNAEDSRFDSDSAQLYIRYLEDHTGFPAYEAAAEFSAVRHLYESPNLNWSQISFDPPLPPLPYVVMELAIGRSLAKVLGGHGDVPERAFTAKERRSIDAQAIQAIEYLGSFGLLHRDFRGSNVHLAGRGDHCRIKVLDLGLVITASEVHIANPNSAVRACWNRSDKQYDWVPPEAKTKPLANFAVPVHSFDTYSLAVFMMRMHGGKKWTREMLKHPDSMRSHRKWKRSVDTKGLDSTLINLMLSSAPEKRPPPRDVRAALFGNLLIEDAQQMESGGAAASEGAAAERSAPAAELHPSRRSRSRSRGGRTSEPVVGSAAV
eukprot:gnl/TRDRNA2_/TRDRNA2_91552_c0_seq2.p1 gnl/TRDRNA2_/TRDRNA2_91552_c0~~gnl/TRDRNA2_/TRDRNA2_91552_c0_seq2.p1  ORF type:complete len:548 (+),score=95.55 gnl/TRDRNA2_/TRDRNA2_91552_c0_seq2:37-1680(+)